MGTVYLASEPALRRLVAVKTLTPPFAAFEVSRTRFEREAKAAAFISHPNVIQILRIGTTDTNDIPFIVMEYVEGKPLDEFIRTEGPIRESEARRIIAALASALTAAHQRGVIHRDVKPSNVIIQKDTGRVFLTDFGVAAAADPSTLGEASRLTDTGLQVGSPLYMSPEQAAGDRATTASDIYSLGVLAYELLTDAPPFSAITAQQLAAAHLMQLPPPLASRRPGLTPELTRVIESCLAKRAEDRPTAAHLVETLAPIPEEIAEWPPASIVALLGRGRKLANLALVLGVVSLLFTLTSRFPPAALRTDGEWWSRYTSEARVAAAGPEIRRVTTEVPNQTGIWLWTLAIVIGAPVGLAAASALAWDGMEVITSFRMARAGAPDDVLRDLVADPDGTSGQLRQRAAAGPFPADAKRLLLLRRRATEWTVAGGLAIGALLALWAVVASIAPSPSPAVPVLATVVMGIAAALMFAGVASRRMAQALHAAKLQDLRSRITSPPGVSETPSRERGILRSVGIATITVFGTTIAAVAGSSLVAGRAALRYGPPTAELADTLESMAASDPLGRASSIWSPLIPAGRATSPLTSATVDSTLQLVSPQELVEALGRNAGGLPTTEAALSRARGTLSADTLRLLERLMQGMGTRRDSSGGYQRVQREMYLGLLGAILARSGGDRNGAFALLHRNAELAESLWSSPDPFAVRIGAGAFQGLALGPSAELRRQQGDSIGEQRLRSLGASIQGYLSLTAWDSHFAGFASTPDELGYLRRVVLSPAIPLAYRLSSLQGVVEGLCLDPPEILRGPLPPRDSMLTALASAAGDSPRSVMVDSLRMVLHSLGRPFPVGTASRLQYCARLAGW
jgi:hypothetical protein